MTIEQAREILKNANFCNGIMAGIENTDDVNGIAEALLFDNFCKFKKLDRVGCLYRVEDQKNVEIIIAYNCEDSKKEELLKDFNRFFENHISKPFWWKVGLVRCGLKVIGEGEDFQIERKRSDAFFVDAKGKEIFIKQ